MGPLCGEVTRVSVGARYVENLLSEARMHRAKPVKTSATPSDEEEEIPQLDDDEHSTFSKIRW